MTCGRVRRSDTLEKNFGEMKVSVIFCRLLMAGEIRHQANARTEAMGDYSTPFDASTPWGALTAALAAHGVLIRSPDPDESNNNEHDESSPATADLQ